MKHTLAIAFNDLLMRLNERDTLIFSLILPVLFTAIIGVGMDASFGGDGDNRFPLAVVDADGGELAAEVLSILDESEVVRTELANDDDNARQLVDDEEVYAALVIPSSFTDELMSGQPAQVTFLFADYNNSQSVREEVQLVLDRVSAAVTAAQTALDEAELVAGFADEAERQVYFSQALAAARKKLNPPPVGVAMEVATHLEEEDEWANFTGTKQSSPGMVVMFGMTTMLGVGIVLVQERRMGTLRRLLITPAGKASILAGKYAGTFVLGLLQTAILILFGNWAFDVPWGNDPQAITLIVLSFSAAITSMGILFATVVRTENQAGSLMTGAAMGMAALGGAWWPIAITPPAMQTLGHLFPSAWAMDAFQTIILQGGGVADVLLESGILLGYAVFFFLLGIWRLKFE